MTIGRPNDTTEDAVEKNLGMVYGGKDTITTGVLIYRSSEASPSRLFNARYNPSNESAVISYSIQDVGRVSLNIFDQRGRRIASIVNGIVTSGRHVAVWDTKEVPAGIYFCRITIDGRDGETGKIVMGK